MKPNKSAGRERLLDRLAKDYRRVLAGVGSEQAFGEAVQQANISQTEMQAISRLARRGGVAIDFV